ncbi:MAG TPA: hypothetical protein VIE16_03610 [Phenylobacterium sp.]|jgi:hypothetical protein
MAWHLARISTAAALAGALALAAPAVALAQAAEPRDDAAQAAAEATPGVRFNCQDGGNIFARFAVQRGRLVAIVDAFDGYGPHTLSARPYAEAPVRLIWSDGQRTLTWSPGVQIMWMDAGAHRMCGGGHHHGG